MTVDPYPYTFLRIDMFKLLQQSAVTADDTKKEDQRERKGKPAI